MNELYSCGLDNGFEFAIIPITNGNPGAGTAIDTEPFLSLDPMIINCRYSFHILPLSGGAFLALPLLFVLIPITKGLLYDYFKRH